ncbi:MAG: carboxypeptidase regulatory-like domain-containing protein, partial [Myxococcales bacterium]|nr:carboxypeptidase regulatory-like domain-containing protein [Myxococcales bacterium]
MLRSVLPLAVLALLLSGNSCPGTSVRVVSPVQQVTTFEFEIEVEIQDPSLDPSRRVATLNDDPLVLVEGPDGRFRAPVAPGPPLRDRNVLRVRIPKRTGKGQHTLVQHFHYRPPGKARAGRISDPKDLIRGPLAHGRVGDWLLANGTARFVVQDVAQRDFHSIGQYGGNLIDAERIGRPKRDNFFEIQPALNIETVVNAQTVTVLNDGQDGTAALLETCGPDDLLDWTNPSDQISQFDFPVTLPPGIDDFDLPVEACTVYRLEPSRSPGEHPWVEMTTTVFNHGPDDLRLFPGDYLNAMGELEQWTSLDPSSAVSLDSGLGENVVTLGLGVFSFYGFGEAEGVSYGRVGVPIDPSLPPDSSFTDSGFSLVLSGVSIPLILIFPPGLIQPPLAVPAGGSASFQRFFVVGDGDAGDLVDAEVAIRGLSHGTVRGCVTVGGVPAPGARVSAGFVRDGAINNVRSAWVADADGCYEGRLPSGSYGIAAARSGTPYEGGGPEPVVHPLAIVDGGEVTQDFALPATGRVKVWVRDETDAPLPARITVVGFDPSPEPLITLSLFGVLETDGGTFRDPTGDRLPFGVARIDYSGARGRASFDLEPGRYQVFVTRGTEYSAWDREIEVTAGAETTVKATLARVLDTAGFVSSDFHVHLIDSLDSRVAARDRVRQFAGEGVDNLVATEHDARSDLLPVIDELGLSRFLTSTLGEEITTPSFGHYNAYPLGLDPERPSGGSIDWGRAAP